MGFEMIVVEEPLLNDHARRIHRLIELAGHLSKDQSRQLVLG